MGPFGQNQLPQNVRGFLEQPVVELNWWSFLKIAGALFIAGYALKKFKLF